MAPEPIPEADAQEQSLPVGRPEEPELDEIPPDVPEADALDQARPLAEALARIPRLRPDVPEADAIEQETPADGDEDDDRR
ncbi:MAG: hypothetical protein ACRDYV_19375 [Acidimicrobiia bacterium]